MTAARARNVPWTPAELAALPPLFAQHGHRWDVIAEALSDRHTAASCRQRYASGVADGEWTKPPVPTAPTKPTVRDILDFPPKLFAVPVPPKATATQTTQCAVLFGDTHVPYQDKACLAVVAQIIRDAQPDLLVHMGDLLDCYKISRFDKDPTRQSGMQDEIDQARALLHQWAQLAPNARRILLEGNHEDRLRKLIWGLPGAHSELARLTAFKQALTWPNLLGLDDIGWEFRPYQGQSRHPSPFPHLILKHGVVVRKWSGMTARGEWEKHGKGGVSGHTHRAALFYHRDHNGSHVWIETGCTSTLLPDYMTDDPDWQQMCYVLTSDGDRFGVEPVYIQDGVGIWRGRRYTAEGITR